MASASSNCGRSRRRTRRRLGRWTVSRGPRHTPLEASASSTMATLSAPASTVRTNATLRGVVRKVTGWWSAAGVVVSELTWARKTEFPKPNHPRTEPNFLNRSVSVPSSVPVSEYPKYPSTEPKFPRTEVPKYPNLHNPSYIYIHPSYILYLKLHNLTCFTLPDSF
jgi:hypothetical protein